MGSITTAINTLLTLSWVDDLNQKLQSKGLPGWLMIGIGVVLLLVIYKLF